MEGGPFDDSLFPDFGNSGNGGGNPGNGGGLLGGKPGADSGRGSGHSIQVMLGLSPHAGADMMLGLSGPGGSNNNGTSLHDVTNAIFAQGPPPQQQQQQQPSNNSADQLTTNSNGKIKEESLGLQSRESLFLFLC